MKLHNLYIDPLIEGGTLDSGEILVNVEFIWDYFHDEDEFIREFSEVITHELLHQCCRNIVPNKYAYGEEKAIRTMLNQPFNDREKRFYNDKRKANFIKWRRAK